MLSIYSRIHVPSLIASLYKKIIHYIKMYIAIITLNMHYKDL
jgi:hypothetical protein